MAFFFALLPASEILRVAAGGKMRCITGLAQECNVLVSYPQKAIAGKKVDLGGMLILLPNCNTLALMFPGTTVCFAILR